MITMNADTEYVHTHIVNYEPTYLVLSYCAEKWADDPQASLHELRDILQEAVEGHFTQMGLRPSDLTDKVGYAGMIAWEADNE